MENLVITAMLGRELKIDERVAARGSPSTALGPRHDAPPGVRCKRPGQTRLNALTRCGSECGTARRAASTARKRPRNTRFPRSERFCLGKPGGAGGTRTQKRDGSHLRKRHRGGHSHPVESRCIRLDPLQRYCGAVRTARLQGTPRARTWEKIRRAHLLQGSPSRGSPVVHPAESVTTSPPVRRSHTPYRPGTRSRRRIGSVTQVAEGLNGAAGSGPLSAGQPIGATAQP